MGLVRSAYFQHEISKVRALRVLWFSSALFLPKENNPLEFTLLPIMMMMMMMMEGSATAATWARLALEIFPADGNGRCILP
jgi:hypothetical protein